MSDFKVGDIVYWFNDYAGDMADNVVIDDLRIESTRIISESEVRQRDWGYHSRREALNALAARLKALLDEDNEPLSRPQENGCHCNPAENYTCCACLNA